MVVFFKEANNSFCSYQWKFCNIFSVWIVVISYLHLILNNKNLQIWLIRVVRVVTSYLQFCYKILLTQCYVRAMPSERGGGVECIGGDTMSALGNILSALVDIMIYVGDIISILGMHSTLREHHDLWGISSVRWGLISVLGFSKQL